MRLGCCTYRRVCAGIRIALLVKGFVLPHIPARRVGHMQWKGSGLGRFLLAIAALFGLSVPLALANAAPAVSGTYQVVRKRLLGSQSQIQMRLHLVNHGSTAVLVQRITLWNLAHAERGGSTTCAVAVPAHASADTTVQFSIRRSDDKLWQKGFRPRLVLQMAGPGGMNSKAVVRLDRTSGQEAK